MIASITDNRGQRMSFSEQDIVPHPEVKSVNPDDDVVLGAPLMRGVSQMLRCPQQKPTSSGTSRLAMIALKSR